jgi:hypothetical protein
VFYGISWRNWLAELAYGTGLRHRLTKSACRFCMARNRFLTGPAKSAEPGAPRHFQPAVSVKNCFVWIEKDVVEIRAQDGFVPVG